LVSPGTIPGTAAGVPAAGTGNLPQVQPSSTVNLVDQTDAQFVRLEQVGVNRMTPPNQYIVPPQLLLVGGSGDFLPQATSHPEESEPGETNMVPTPTGPVPVIPLLQPTGRANDVRPDGPIGFARPADPDVGSDTSAVTPSPEVWAEKALLVSDADEAATSWLGVAAESPGALNIVLASALEEPAGQ
jgi:hypothetical protein